MQDADSSSTTLAATADPGSNSLITLKRYSNYLTSKRSSSNGGSLQELLNGVIRKKLKIIPKNVT